MSKIIRFTLNASQSQLSITGEQNDDRHLSYEYLRVCCPTIEQSKRAGGNPSLVTHKQAVRLLSIEIVGKHGYRFIFDDNHSAIYSSEYLDALYCEHDSRWSHYLSELKASGHSREATISIKQL